MSSKIHPFGDSGNIAILAGESIAILTKGVAELYQAVVDPNIPHSLRKFGSVTADQHVFGPYAAATTLRIFASSEDVLYETGVAPKVNDQAKIDVATQYGPVAVDATGPVSGLAILCGLVTSTTGAAVAGTIPTGTVMDAASDFDIGEFIDWTVINTGAANAFTVTAAATHTIVGSAVVALGTSGRFRTRKAAANTFITYRLS